MPCRHHVAAQQLSDNYSYVSLIYKVINLTVVQSPKFIQSLGSTTTISVKTGEDVKMACVAEGIPHPVVSWKKIGNGSMSCEWKVV